MLYGDLDVGVSDIGELAGEHFIHHYAERIDIAPRVWSFPTRLLGCNIVN